MNTILQKRIEEAARNYADSLALPEWDKRSIHAIDFKKGAISALQNQWISVDEALPSFGSLCLVDGKSGLKLSIYMNMFVDAGNITQRIGSVTHWMEIPSLEGGEE